MPGKPGQHVIQLRQLHLKLAFPAARAAGKNIKDELGAVNDLQVDDLLKIAELRGGKVVVKNHQVRVQGLRFRADLLHLAASQQSGGIRDRTSVAAPFPPLGHRRWR